MAWFLAMLIIVAGYAVSWLVTCGIVYLITLCFGWTFTWSVATGIWLVTILMRTIFNVTVKK